MSYLTATSASSFIGFVSSGTAQPSPYYCASTEYYSAISKIGFCVATTRSGLGTGSTQVAPLTGCASTSLVVNYYGATLTCQSPWTCASYTVFDNANAGATSAVQVFCAPTDYAIDTLYRSVAPPPSTATLTKSVLVTASATGATNTGGLVSSGGTASATAAPAGSSTSSPSAGSSSSSSSNGAAIGGGVGGGIGGAILLSVLAFIGWKYYSKRRQEKAAAGMGDPGYPSLNQGQQGYMTPMPQSQYEPKPYQPPQELAYTPAPQQPPAELQGNRW